MIYPIFLMLSNLYYLEISSFITLLSMEVMFIEILLHNTFVIFHIFETYGNFPYLSL